MDVRNINAPKSICDVLVRTTAMLSELKNNNRRRLIIIFVVQFILFE